MQEINTKYRLNLKVGDAVLLGGERFVLEGAENGFLILVDRYLKLTPIHPAHENIEYSQEQKPSGSIGILMERINSGSIRMGADLSAADCVELFNYVNKLEKSDAGLSIDQIRKVCSEFFFEARLSVLESRFPTFDQAWQQKFVNGKFECLEAE